MTSMIQMLPNHFPFRSVEKPPRLPIANTIIAHEVAANGLISLYDAARVFRTDFQLASQKFGWRVKDMHGNASAELFVNVLTALGAKPEAFTKAEPAKKRATEFSAWFDVSTNKRTAYYQVFTSPFYGALFRLICAAIYCKTPDRGVARNVRRLDEVLHTIAVHCGVPRNPVWR